MTGNLASAGQPGVSILILRQIVQLGRSHGLESARLLADAGLSEDWLLQTEGWVAAECVEHLIRRGQASIGNPLLGLLSAPQVNLSMLGVLGYVTQTSSTVQGLIESTARYERLLSDIGTTSLHHRPGMALWQWECAFVDADVRRHAVECVLGCWANMLRLARRPAQRPLLGVHFQHARPEGVAAQAHERFFGCPVHFGQDSNALLLAPFALALPLALADPALHRALEEHARQQLEARRREANLVDAVRALLLQELSQGITPVRERIAGQLGISARSLHRKLETANQSFRGLVDDVRLTLAQNTLRASALPVAQVAQQLGFQESQSFIRWFKRVQGMTPGEFRGRAAD